MPQRAFNTQETYLSKITRNDYDEANAWDVTEQGSLREGEREGEIQIVCHAK